MADKILKIKLEVDTGQAAKLVKITDDLTKQSNTQIAKSKELLAIEAKVNEARNAAVSSLSKVIIQAEQYNNLLKQGGTAAYLANTQAKAGLDSYNNKLVETQNNLKKVIAQQGSLTSSFAFASGQSSAPSSRFQASVSDTAAQGVPSRNPLTGTINQERVKLDTLNAEKLAQEKLKESILATNKARLAEHNSLDIANEKHRSLITRIVEGVSIYRVYNTVLNTTLNSLRAIPEIGIQLEATKSILTATVGSESSVNSVLAELNKEAERTGISVAVLRESFRTFNASALLAGESTETAYRIFTNLNTTITSLHLSADLAQHTFLAFSQILNKGKVQSEELVKQLGNLLPGAFATMAKALNISTQELSKRMKQGLVTAHDSLDAFAQEYAKQFSQSFVIAQQGLNSNIGRLQTSFTLLGESIYSQTNGAMIDFVKGLTSISNEFRAVIEGTSKWNSELNFLKTTIEIIAFTAISSSISNLGIKFIALTGNTAAMTAAVTKLKSAFSFLSVPTAIVAGILLIANQLKEAIVPAETLIDKLRASRKEAEDLVKQNAQRANLSEAGKITFDVENSEEVKKKFKDIKTLAEELEITKERLANSKFNPFTSINAIQKDKEFIRQGTEELKLQLKEFEKLKEEKKLQLNIDAIAAKNKETDFPAAAAAREAEQAEKDLAKIKDINFGKETAYNDKLRKDLEEEYKAQLNTLQFRQKALELEAKDQSARGNQRALSELPDRLNALQQQELDLKAEYQKKFEVIAIDSQNKIYKSAADKNRLTFEQFYKGLQDIESAGVKTRGGREGAVSPTGALGRGQVQPSTLNDFTGNVPADILALEKKARFNLNVLKKKVTLEPAEIERLRDYALANVDKINATSEKLFKKLVDDFGGDFIKAAVAYNTGPARVKLASAAADKAGRADFESFLPTSGKLGLNPRALAEVQGYAKKARGIQGGDSFDVALLAKQTEQQAAIDEQRSAAQDKHLLDLQKQLDIDTRIKEIKEEEIALNINEASTAGLTLQAEQLRIIDEFEKKRLEYISKGADAFIPRLAKIKEEKLLQAQIADIKDKYQQEEERYNASLEDITRKSQLKYLNTQQAVKETVVLQSEHLRIQGLLIAEWEKQAKLSGDVRDNVEAENAARERTRQLTQTASIITQPIGELTQSENELTSRTGQIDLGRNAAEQLAQDARDKGLLSEQAYQDKLLEIDTNTNIRRIQAHADYYGTLVNFAGNSFSEITNAAVQMYGAQSTAARAAFAVQKAFNAGEAIISGIKATQDAYAAGMSTGGPTAPAVAVAFASLSAVATAARVAAILSQPVPGGAAHGGLENVPKEQTYLLDKGERVLSPRQNVDITNKVTNIHDKVSGQAPQGNIRIVNVMDENLVYNALGSDQSERIIMNIVNRNR